MMTPMVLVASPGFGANRVPEAIALVRAAPGKHVVASPGNGTLNHLMGEMFKQTARIDLIHVPYKSGTHPDLIAGRTALLFDPRAGAAAGQAGQHECAGHLAPLAAAARCADHGRSRAAQLRHRTLVWPVRSYLHTACGHRPGERGGGEGDDLSRRGAEGRGLNSQVMAVPNAQVAKSFQADLARWRKVVAELQVTVD